MPPQINRQSLEHTVRFVHDLDRARNVEDIASKVLQHLAQIGAETVIATAMPNVGINRRQQLSGVLFHEMPSEWVRNYAARGYAFKRSGHSAHDIDGSAILLERTRA